MSDVSSYSDASSSASSHKQTTAEWLADPQTIIALSAVVLSLCGVFISLYEASLMREEQRASVWPWVGVGPSFNSEVTLIRVQNNGVGPARIRAAAVTYEGEVMQTWGHLLHELTGEERGFDFRQSLVSGSVLPDEGEGENMLTVPMDSTQGPNHINRRITRSLRQAVMDGQVDVRVCYCSVYEDCWVTTLQDRLARFLGKTTTPQAKRVETCEGEPQSGI